MIILYIYLTNFNIEALIYEFIAIYYIYCKLLCIILFIILSIYSILFLTKYCLNVKILHIITFIKNKEVRNGFIVQKIREQGTRKKKQDKYVPRTASGKM